MVVLVGCGFHLRGSGNLSSIKGPVFVSTDAFSEVADELRRTLEYSEIALSKNAELANLTATITREDFTRRTVSVDDANNTRGVELRYSVHLKVTRTDSEYAQTEVLETEREYEFDSGGVLGSADEEDLLLEEMRGHLVRTILNHLTLASREISE
ncbi:MAG: LPS assembly lipoprotein LptE [Pseudomonadota bacterium]